MLTDNFLAALYDRKSSYLEHDGRAACPSKARDFASRTARRQGRRAGR